ncbi:MAG: sugar transferase [Mycobacterium sp.]
MSPTKPDLVERIDVTGLDPSLDSPDELLAEAAVRPVSVTDRIEWQRRWARNLRITDTLVVAGAVLLGQIVRFGQTDDPTGKFQYYISIFSAVFVVIWLIALSAMRTRSPRLMGSGAEEYRRVVAASFMTFGTIAIAALLLKMEIARGYLAIGLPVGIAGLLVTRAAWRRYVMRERARGGYRTSVLIVGERGAATTFARELTRGGVSGYSIAGVSIPGYGPSRGENVEIGGRRVPILGDERHVLHAIRECNADTVAIAGTEHFGVKGIRRLIWDLEPMGIDLMASTGVMDVALSRLVMRPSAGAGLPVLHIEKPQYEGAKKFQKRLFDICFALTALSLSMPLFVTAALAVRLTSRGPAFYRAERIGIQGRPFSMLKFRTMVRDADKLLSSLQGANESDGLLFKIRDDPRVTAVGRVLRRFSIDEIPQFINVLRGEMSVVGPRPPLRREVDAYDVDVSRRLLVKPGITGLWQVSGRSDLSWEESVRLDLAYVDNWSMIADALIIARTIAAVLRRSGAY